MKHGLISLKSQDHCKKSLRPCKGLFYSGLGSSLDKRSQHPLVCVPMLFPAAGGPELSLSHCLTLLWQGVFGRYPVPYLLLLPVEWKSDALRNGLEALPGLRGPGDSSLLHFSSTADLTSSSFLENLSKCQECVIQKQESQLSVWFSRTSFRSGNSKDKDHLVGQGKSYFRCWNIQPFAIEVSKERAATRT